MFILGKEYIFIVENIVKHGDVKEASIRGTFFPLKITPVTICSAYLVSIFDMYIYTYFFFCKMGPSCDTIL